MQNQDETIDLWHEFEDIKIEVYSLWFYQQLQAIKNQETLQLQRVKEMFKVYRSHYSWIEHSKIKKLALRQRHGFPTDCISLVVVKVLRPLLLQLYFAKIPH